MDKEDLLTMELHSERNINKYLRVLRVFGGWIYYDMSENQDGTWQVVSNFVPEELNCNTKNN